MDEKDLDVSPIQLVYLCSVINLDFGSNVDFVQFQNHIKDCPARIAFDRHKYTVGEQSTLVGADVKEHDIAFVGETWDLVRIYFFIIYFLINFYSMYI